jgi:hypothetical protein
VLWPLLDYSTNTANAESDTLLEEGIRLMQAILSACPELPQPVQVRLLLVSYDYTSRGGLSGVNHNCVAYFAARDMPY